MTKHERDQLKDVLDGLITEIRISQRLLDKYSVLRRIWAKAPKINPYEIGVEIRMLKAPAEGLCKVLGLKLVEEERKDLESLEKLLFDSEQAAEAFAKGCSCTIYRFERATPCGS